MSEGTAFPPCVYCEKFAAHFSHLQTLSQKLRKKEVDGLFTMYDLPERAVVYERQIRGISDRMP